MKEHTFPHMPFAAHPDPSVSAEPQRALDWAALSARFDAQSQLRRELAAPAHRERAGFADPGTVANALRADGQRGVNQAVSGYRKATGTSFAATADGDVTAFGGDEE